MRTLILAVTLLLLPLANFAAEPVHMPAMLAQVEAGETIKATEQQGNTAVEQGKTAEEHAKAGEHEEHGLPLHPVVITHVGPLPITNSMVVTWIVAAFLIIFARIAMSNVQMIPAGLQNFWEWMVESLYKFLEDIIGPALVKKTFWFFATIFIFILFCNWFGLIPGVGTVGNGIQTDHGFVLTHPFFRGANADLNMTFAMAMVFFACWIVWALQANGFGGFILHLFGPKGDTTGLLKALMIVVFFIVGILEVVSILFRPVSLSFRLYGNVYAGESMLEAMQHVVPKLAWLVPIPFYFLEVLVGLVQALVFMLLTSVFTLLICSHDEGDHPAHEH
ncbi:MAG: synthase subunit a [Verrucomicrobiales bacterium]|nr:synthase subunit a [Verrucomicrobiales bacterium]